MHTIHTIFPSTLRARRPEGAGASPREEPDGIDYRSIHPPSENFDCEVLATLFRDLKLNETRKCLGELSKSEVPVRVIYELERDFAPYLKLVSDESTPACLKEQLPKIPVPREIFFQSNEDGNLNCYSARLNIEANKPLDVRLPIHGFQLRLDFPVEYPFQSDAELIRLLGAWALSPIWNLQNKSVNAKLVPDALCQKCLGEKNMVDLRTTDPVTWP